MIKIHSKLRQSWLLNYAYTIVLRNNNTDSSNCICGLKESEILLYAVNYYWFKKNSIWLSFKIKAFSKVFIQSFFLKEIDTV